MFMLVRIGWRNVWRNPRRSAIMLAALVVGVWGLVMMYAANRSMLMGMVDLAIMSNTAHIQVHARGYQENPEMTKAMEKPERLISAVRKAGHVVAVSPRAKVTAMISSAHGSGGVMLIGIDPEAEAEVTVVAERMKAGRFLKPGDIARVIIGRSLAEKLEVKPGKKVVLYVRDVNKELKVLGLKVAGVFDTGTEAVDKFSAFVPLSYFQKELALGPRIHELAVKIDDESHLEETKQALIKALGNDPDLEVLTWREIFPFLDQMVSFADIANYIILAIVGVAISLGVANTMVMSVFERFREIGIMKAIGTKPRQIFGIVVAEAVFLTFTGLGLGSGVSKLTLLVWERYGLDLSMFSGSLSSIGMPTVYYPVVYLEDWVVTWVALIALAAVSALYPAVKAARKNPVEAIRM